MKCLLVTHQLDFSGAPIALSHLARAMRNEDHEVKLFTFRDGPLRESFESLGVELITPARTDRFDIVIFNTVFGCQVAPQFRAIAKRTVAWIHESPTFCRFHPKLSYKEIPAESIDLMLGVAGFQVEFLQRQFPNKSVVRFDNTILPYLGEDVLSARDVCGETRPFRVAFMGGLEPRKGTNNLSKFLDYGRPERMEIHCIGLSWQELVGVIGLRGLEKRTNLSFIAHGRVTHSEALHRLARCDLLLSLSIDEVKPLTILEAIYLGIPVVATNIPAHLELEGEFKGVKCVMTPIEFICNNQINVLRASCIVKADDRLSLERYQWRNFLERTKILIAAVNC